MLKITWYLLPLQIILLLGCCCGLAFAQNNNVTVNGVVDVQGTVDIDVDSGQLQPTGAITSEDNFKNATGIANGMQDIGSSSSATSEFVWSDIRTWYTPRYFEYSEMQVCDMNIGLTSNRGNAWASGNPNYSYDYSHYGTLSLFVPIFRMNWFVEDFNYSLFGLSSSPFSNLESLWRYRGSPRVTLATTPGYMGDASIEHQFSFVFDPMALMNKDEFRPFTSGVRSLIQFVVSMMTCSYCLRLVTNW